MSRVLPSLLALCSCAAPYGAGPDPSVHEVPDLQRRLAENPANGETHLRLGLRWAKAGDGLRAQHYLLRAYELGVDARRALPPLIRVSLALAAWEAALRHTATLMEAMRARCELGRNDAACREAAELLATLAGLHESLGRPDRGLRYLTEAVTLQPTFADAYLGIARLHEEHRAEPNTAKKVLRRGLAALRGGPGSDELRRRLSYLESRGDRK